MSQILVTGMSTQAQETWAFTKCPRLARYYASLGHSHRRVCRPLHCTYFCIVLYNSSISLSLVRVRKHHSLRDRVSDQLPDAMYNQTLPHRDKAMAETRKYHRNVAWTQVSWHSENGTQPSFPVCTKGNASDCLKISKIRRSHVLQLSESNLENALVLYIVVYQARLVSLTNWNCSCQKATWKMLWSSVVYQARLVSLTNWKLELSNFQ